MDAETSLIEFTKYTNDQYIPAAHHALIADRLEAVERGELKRLAIFMPPRHGKSELASRRFPAWYLGRNPKSQIIAASANGDLAGDFGREVRNIVASPEYRAIFEGGSLAADSQAAGRWHTEQGGSYVSAGVGAMIVGRGAHVFLIDDPIKSREDADSEVSRQRLWDWYRSAAYTRLMPGGAIVLIQTRWHDDDLAGRIMEQMRVGGEAWEVLSLKAIADDGAALWPEWYDAERLKQIRGVVGDREWSAQYQQEPVPESGAFFKREWVNWYETAPAHLRVYGASDYAVTEGGGDFTVHGVAGVDPNDDLYILDIWREQGGPQEWVDAFCDLVLRWKPLDWAEESGQIRSSVGPFLQKRQLERKAYTNRVPFTSVGDKPTRAQSIRGRMSMRKVYFPINAPWVETLLHELLRFPAGKNDDQVDVMSLFGRMLATMEHGVTPAVKAGPKLLQNATFNDLLAAHAPQKRARI